MGNVCKGSSTSQETSKASKVDQTGKGGNVNRVSKGSKVDEIQNVPTCPLPSGATIPMVGLGTWMVPAGVVETQVKTAIDIGYRHIDCALLYGNEKEIGSALKDVIQQGKVKREDLFITSKLWNHKHAPEDVRPALMSALSDLSLDYMDLYLMHSPIPYKSGDDLLPADDDGNPLYSDTDYLETWKAMEKCVDEGLVRDIGISNFNSEQTQRILDNCVHKPATNQIEIHPYLTNVKLVDFCQKRGLLVTGYSTLGSAHRPWARPEEPAVLDNSDIKMLAEKYKRTPAQVVLKWSIQRGIVVIPKSVTPSRIKDNISLFDFDISKDDMNTITKLDKNLRYILLYSDVDGKRTVRDENAPYSPFNIEF